MAKKAKKKLSASQRKRLATIARKKREAQAQVIGAVGLQEPQPTMPMFFPFADVHLERLSNLYSQTKTMNDNLEDFMKRIGGHKFAAKVISEERITTVVQSDNVLSHVTALSDLIQRQLNLLGERIAVLSDIA